MHKVCCFPVRRTSCIDNGFFFLTYQTTNLMNNLLFLAMSSWFSLHERVFWNSSEETVNTTMTNYYLEELFLEMYLQIQQTRCSISTHLDIVFVCKRKSNIHSICSPPTPDGKYLALSFPHTSQFSPFESAGWSGAGREKWGYQLKTAG